MIRKQLTLNAKCNHCNSNVFQSNEVVKIKDLTVVPKLTKAVASYFPKHLKCNECGGNNLTKQYTFTHTETLPTDLNDKAEAIDRCKAQIAATMDYNNDMPKNERIAVREAFQTQLKRLLGDNNINGFTEFS